MVGRASPMRDAGRGEVEDQSALAFAPQHLSVESFRTAQKPAGVAV